MRRSLLIPVSAKDRDYLIRVLRNEQAHWLSVATYRQIGRAPGHTAEEHADFILDAKTRANKADEMARQVGRARRPAASPATERTGQE